MPVGTCLCRIYICTSRYKEANIDGWMSLKLRIAL